MPAISFQSVSKTYQSSRGAAGAAVKALDHVSFDIEQGEFFGLLGPNGAGKTSLISILAGLSRATGGRVLVHGSDVVADYALTRRHLGVVPQELVFDPFFTVREALRIQSGYFGIKRNDDWIDELLASLGLADKAQANMRQLSGGMKRRVLVAQALVDRIQPLTVALLLPLFFTFSGLNTQIGLLDSAYLWQMAALVLVAAIGGKGVACWLAARATGISNREASG